MNEPEPISTDQLLLMYRHLKGMLPLLEAMLIQRGAINPIRQFSSQPLVLNRPAQVSA